MPNVFPLFLTRLNLFCDLCLCCQLHLKTTLVLLRWCLKVKKVPKTDAKRFPPFSYVAQIFFVSYAYAAKYTLKPLFWFVSLPSVDLLPPQKLLSLFICRLAYSRPPPSPKLVSLSLLENSSLFWFEGLPSAGLLPPQICVSFGL